MDFGQQRLIQQQNARNMMYQNSVYQFERRDKKTLIIDVSDRVSSITHLGNASEFSIPLFEPLIIDKLSDVYLDSFLTHNSHVCDTGDKMGFALKINEFNVNSNVASLDSTPTHTVDSKQHIYNSILIPNENNDAAGSAFSCVIHKGKKMNYVCSINPGKISIITGKISDLAGQPIYYNGRAFYVRISATSASVPANTSFTFSGTETFRTSFHMENGATDLYFYETSGASFNAETTFSSVSHTITATGTGLNAKTTQIGTGRNGDEGRFIAEFVIVARE